MFIDIKDFTIVLFISIVVLSGIQRQLSRTLGDAYNPEFSEFFKEIDATYDSGFGSFSENKSSFTWNYYFFFLVQSVLFALVMFNFLIAIISKTYENVSEKVEYYNILELLQLLIDYGYFKSAFSIFYNEEKEKYHKYLHIIVERNNELGKLTQKLIFRPRKAASRGTRFDY